MPSLVASNSKAEELIAPVEGLDVPPSFRPEHITTLIESVNRYNPESLEVLEEYLALQCSDGTFDCLADLAILKLYLPIACFYLFMMIYQTVIT
jgi:translation initiation factor 3 subunit K